ncbi:keratin-associated protein 17-1-like [Pogoniulus pusillus]|uniref:keratin-associated protein 17-1-like n=1 Tax=Pogoniulus pusillus TaxID=488313 RepID=UPI0030B93D7E
MCSRQDREQSPQQELASCHCTNSCCGNTGSAGCHGSRGGSGCHRGSAGSGCHGSSGESRCHRGIAGSGCHGSSAGCCHGRAEDCQQQICQVSSRMK